ncbi:helix-turn-helix domain-containing protein [Chitinophaga japonensis]|uniref:Transcriptional regulator n=1 Tax=Chitinophaga japonensis TaxID=104662 RepID=A0A562T2Z7_CHIJA|nr:helix-turn-helix domain-containing protein [Chitinophaga japonensis]TWI87793.1 transcriptional regulator [Chitinophaga japonensis]
MDSEIEIGKFKLHVSDKVLTSPDQLEIQLTDREFVVLRHLIAHKNWIVRKREVVLLIWGDECALYYRTAEVIIFRLKKIISTDKRLRLESVSDKEEWWLLLEDDGYKVPVIDIFAEYPFYTIVDEKCTTHFLERGDTVFMKKISSDDLLSLDTGIYMRLDVKEEKFFFHGIRYEGMLYMSDKPGETVDKLEFQLHTLFYIGVVYKKRPPAIPLHCTKI